MLSQAAGQRVVDKPGPSCEPGGSRCRGLEWGAWPVSLGEPGVLEGRAEGRQVEASPERPWKSGLVEGPG